MKGKPLVEVHRDPKEYQQLIDEVRAGRSLFEKVLKIAPPDWDEHYVSVSTAAKSFLASIFYPDHIISDYKPV